MKIVHRGGNDYIHIWNLTTGFHQGNIYTEILLHKINKWTEFYCKTCWF